MDATQPDTNRTTTDGSISLEQLRQRIGRVPVSVSVHLCQRRMKLSEFMALGPGSVISFETPHAAPLELKADRATIAIGQAVRNGTRIGLRLSSFVTQRPASPMAPVR